MDIYTILSSKPHNQHYLNRYIMFIQNCKLKNQLNKYEYMEKHHICPKAKDMFPEYKSLDIYSWNKIELTVRQHFIAHIILWKVFPYTNSQTFALWAMKHKNKEKINSKLYESLKKDHSLKITNLSKNMIHSDNSKLMRSKKMSNKIWITDGVQNMRISNTQIIPENYYIGRSIIKSVNRTEISKKFGKIAGDNNKNKVIAFDLIELKPVSISREIFINDKERFCGITSKRIPQNYR